MEDNVTAYLGRIAVLKEHRGKKVGAYLLRELEQEAKEERCAVFYVRSAVACKGFYENSDINLLEKSLTTAEKMHIHMRKTL